MTLQAPTLHPLGVGELLDAAIYVYRKNFVTLVGIGAVFAVLFLFFQFVAAFLFSPYSVFFWGPFSPPSPGWIGDPLPLIFVYLEGTAINGLLGPICIVMEVGAFAFATSELRLGYCVSIGDAYRQALRRWISLLSSGILIQLSVIAASLLIIVPFILIDTSGYVVDMLLFLAALAVLIPFSVPLVFLSARWSLATPAIMLENLGALKGMGRSWRLVGKSFWRTGAVLLFAGVLVNLLTYAVFLAAQYAASLLPNSIFLATAATSAGGLVAGAVIQPLAYVVVTFLYYDLRVRHEGYDLQLALEQLKQPAPAVSSEAPA